MVNIIENSKERSEADIKLDLMILKEHLNNGNIPPDVYSKKYKQLTLELAKY